jgi:hypothetical protein
MLDYIALTLIVAVQISSYRTLVPVRLWASGELKGTRSNAMGLYYLQLEGVCYPRHRNSN